MTLAAGQPGVALTISPPWLNDARRAFPVMLDLPIVTGDAAVHTTWWGTVDSCAPTVQAPLGAVVVGVSDGCSYHGLAYFNTDVLLPHTPIISATLHLYSPPQTGPTGVQVYANRSVPITAVYDLPRWTTAPALTGTAMTENASSGGWHSWDVTGLVQQWVNDERSNGGLTLLSSGPPVRFASPLGAAPDSPTFAPSLEITFAPPGTTTPAGLAPHALAPHNIDNAGTVYGISGSFALDNFCDTYACGGATEMQTVWGALQGAYVRIGVNMRCVDTTTADVGSWWNTSNLNPDPSAPGGYATFGSQGSLLDLVQEAVNDDLIPIIDLVPNANCPFNQFWSSNNSSEWYEQAGSLANAISRPKLIGDNLHLPYPTNRWIYFEIGNEMNVNPSYYNDGFVTSGGQPDWQTGYPLIFMEAARAINDHLSQHGYSLYRILTGGILDPTATANLSGCNVQDQSSTNYQAAQAAIQDAETPSQVPSLLYTAFGVGASHLGLAVHPYHYGTPDDGQYWKNYYHSYGVFNGFITLFNTYAGPCGNLQDMINTWTNATTFPGGLPVFFTETNWTTLYTSGTCSNSIGCKGAYLMDLMTWLHKHSNYGSTSGPLRVMWYRGADDQSESTTQPPPLNQQPPHGLYTKSGGTEQMPADSGIVACGSIGTQPTLLQTYSYLLNGSCY